MAAITLAPNVYQMMSSNRRGIDVGSAPCRRFRPAVILRMLLLTLLGIVLTTSLVNHIGGVDEAKTQTSSTMTAVDVDTTVDDPVSSTPGKEEEEVEVIDVEGRKNAKRVSDATKREVASNYRHQRRLLQAGDTCLKRPMGMAETILFDPHKTVSMCMVPKVGCTHWINIFRFISNNTDYVLYDTPADIPRWITHYGRPMKTASLKPKIKRDPKYFAQLSFLSDTFRFMFVRHPIRRLWSAWVDKFLLPDFWFTEGPYVAEYLNLSEETYECPTNITFNQFLRFATHAEFVQWPQNSNTHWRPIKYLCDPCIFHPHLIGKMETFSEDTRIALSAIDMESYLNDRRRERAKSLKGMKGRSRIQRSESGFIWRHSLFSEDRAVHEMTMLTEYNIEWMKVKEYQERLKTCGIDELFIARRLWKAFQYNGYIRSNIEFSLRRWDSDGLQWHKALFRAYLAWPMDKALRLQQQSEQRETFLRTSFTHIPITTIINIKSFYEDDFRQFGYSFDP